MRMKVLVTTRDRSVAGVPGLFSAGDMTEEKALDLLGKKSLTVGQPGAASGHE